MESQRCEDHTAGAARPVHVCCTCLLCQPLSTSVGHWSLSLFATSVFLASSFQKSKPWVLDRPPLDAALERIKFKLNMLVIRPSSSYTATKATVTWVVRCITGRAYTHSGGGGATKPTHLSCRRCRTALLPPSRFLLRWTVRLPLTAAPHGCPSRLPLTRLQGASAAPREIWVNNSPPNQIIRFDVRIPFPGG